MTAVSASRPLASAGMSAVGRPVGAHAAALAARPGRLLPACFFASWPAGAPVLPATALAATAGSAPLLTKPRTPWPASGPGYSCALTEKLGRESPPMVD